MRVKSCAETPPGLNSARGMTSYPHCSRKSSSHPHTMPVSPSETTRSHCSCWLFSILAVRSMSMAWQTALWPAQPPLHWAQGSEASVLWHESGQLGQHTELSTQPRCAEPRRKTAPSLSTHGICKWGLLNIVHTNLPQSFCCTFTSHISELFWRPAPSLGNHTLLPCIHP